MVSAPDVVKPNPPPIAHLKRALPFAIPFATVPLALIGAAQGGWTVLLLPLFVWGSSTCSTSLWARTRETRIPPPRRRTCSGSGSCP